MVYLHRLVASPPNGMWVRHIDGNKLNNRSCNLQIISSKQSAAERIQGKRPSKKVYRGVRSYDNGKHYSATFRGAHLGIYPTPLEAAKAYDKAAWDRYGLKATLNFPHDYID